MRIGVTLISLCLGVHSAAAQPPAGAPAAGPSAASQEQLLWQQIETLSQADLPTESRPAGAAWFHEARQRRQMLAGWLKLYLTLYPGGVHRDRAVRLELASLFEMGTLRGGAFDALRERVAELLRYPPSQAALHEAAYWEIICRRPDSGSSVTGSVAASPDMLDPDLAAAYREYIRTYPGSRYVPRLAGLLFDEAARHGAQASMQELVDVLRRHWAGHPMTAALEAGLRRHEAVGRPFWPLLRDLSGQTIEQRSYLGAPVLIVVWSSFDEASRRCVRGLETLRIAHPELRVIGVSLDTEVTRIAAACRELGVDWPQSSDGLGWGGEFVQKWGVRRIPCVLAIDRSGCLLGMATESDWQTLAQRALQAAGRGAAD